MWHKHSHRISFGLLAVTLIWGGFVLGSLVKHPSTPTVSQASTEVPSQPIRYRIQGDEIVLSGEIVGAGKTVAEVTQAITAEHKTTFVYTTSALGWFVTEIAGVKQNPSRDLYWLFYINGKLANQGSDKMVLHSGDALAWKLTHTL